MAIADFIQLQGYCYSGFCKCVSIFLFVLSFIIKKFYFKSNAPIKILLQIRYESCVFVNTCLIVLGRRGYLGLMTFNGL